MKRMIYGLLVLLLVFQVPVFAAEADMSEWAVAEVNEAIQLGLVPDDLQQDYQDPITRAEFAEIAVTFVAKHYDKTVEDMIAWYVSTRVDGQGNPLVFHEDAFTDIADSKYAYYIKCASTMGITNGRGDGIFDPDAYITREEAATMLLRVYFCYGSGIKLGPKSAEVDLFSDVGEISSWADTAVRYMYQFDVMKGVSGTSYAPKLSYTKEQSIATFLRLYKAF
ncbi:MAG: S-layer homology domain-containing protein [Clostridia bacterium]|nr:S-layer homology domain-containing protein [Clostridia bacterium]